MLSLIFSPVLLAFALSLDGFGAGVTYGLRKTRIPLLSVLIISLCSGLVLGISMQAGALLQRFFSPFAASVIGAVILILLGCWSLWQQLKRAGDSESEPPLVLHKEVEERSEASVSGELPATAAGIPAKRSEPGDGQKAVFSLEIRKLGIVIQILRSPARADMDDSGSISPWEAMWLGIALSLDAFGAGLGAAMLGFSPLGTAVIVAIFSGIFLLLGMKIGLRFASSRSMKYISYLPAFLLIIMGIMKLL